MENISKKGLTKNAKIALGIIIPTAFIVIGALVFLLLGSFLFEKVTPQVLSDALNSALVSESADDPKIITSLENKNGFEIIYTEKSIPVGMLFIIALLKM